MMMRRTRFAFSSDTLIMYVPAQRLIVVAPLSARYTIAPARSFDWRDLDYLPAAVKSENYRKNFTQAVGR